MAALTREATERGGAKETIPLGKAGEMHNFERAQWHLRFALPLTGA